MIWEWFFGRHTVLELLQTECPVKRFIIAEDAEGELVEDILNIARSKGLKCERVQKRMIDSLVFGNHQGVAIQAQIPGPIDFKSFLAGLPDQPQGFVCVLDEVQDPQNLGAILRSAAAFSCLGVVVSTWRQAGMTGTVMRASSGAAVHVPVAEIANIGVAIERLKEKGFWIYGASVEDGRPLDQEKMSFPMAIVLGNEHRGIKPTLKKACDHLISIPQSQAIQSLNVSSAASIFFYEIFRQGRK